MIGILKKALGSIEYSADRRLRQHLNTNPALIRMRYPFMRRSGEGFLKRALLVYFLVVALFLVDEFLLRQLFPSISNPGHFNLFGSEGDFLTAQVTLIGLIFPIAVSLVTIILERSNATRLDSDIKLYNHASMTYAVGASCLSLVAVYVLSLFFSTDGAKGVFSYVADNKLPRSIKEFLDGSYVWMFVPVLHIWWLVINFVALWYFLKISLAFVQPSRRMVLRQQYAGNVLIPANIRQILLNGYYRGSRRGRLGLDDDNLIIVFGMGYGSGLRAVTRDFRGVYELHDVWMGPLCFFLRRWLARREDNAAQSSPLSHSLFFPPVFDREYSGEMIVCECMGDVPLTRLEKIAIRICFRFRKVKPT